MLFLMIFLVVVTAVALSTVRSALHDGRGPSRPPTSHGEDRQFRSPTAW